MKYTRTPVTTKEIVKYLKLRIKRLKEELFKKSKIQDLIIVKRKSELDRLLKTINTDSIKQEIEKMKKHNYTKYPVSSIDGKPMPEEAVKGLTKALEDVKEGRYKVVSNHKGAKK